jgi:type I restriction-modification system DNA methylase subunit
MQLSMEITPKAFSCKLCIKLLERDVLAAPKEIIDLVERFERNLPEYQSNTYKEAQTRQEFINPFFKALGWDMDNEQGWSEAYKEVLHESSLKVGSTTKAPDYAFKIGENIKFLVEAKKPSVNLEESADPAYQLRSYAWNAKLPISILTDFEELAIYDCRYPPKKTDRANTALIRYLKYTDYIKCWDWIAKNFSKKAIQQGYLDKFLVESKGKKGTKEVDEVFLEEITSWREDLAQNIAIRNSDLKVEELNASVQATIDRIVFLRICEDRGIEKYGQIQGIASGDNIYNGLCNLFKHADDRYNSGLFHFRNEPEREFPDLLALQLKIDDKVLKDITRSLYPPSPYNFAIISPEILGQVYEQFLGKVIRLTDGHRAKIEDKPEVKKAGGVKYTPSYIVQHIVKTTIGPLIKGKTPLEVALIHILDPACGSGSFLLVAYRYLLDWHLDWYIRNLAPVLDKGYSITSATVRKLLPVAIEEEDENNSQKIKRGLRAKRVEAKVKARTAAASIPIYKTNDGEWHLTIAERKRILLDNIYGVDIDRQAVEVTKLSLLLKVLEGENQQTVSDLLKYSRERVLPDLGQNIKCGNSLISTDIMQINEWLRMEKAEQDRINPFDWESEFPAIMQNGGFHAVIGNPPYVRQEMLSDLKSYLQQHYQVYHGTADLYSYFIERGVSLLRGDGIFSYIVANKWMRANYGEPLRRWLKGLRIEDIVDFGDLQVFQGATTYPCIIRITKLPTNSGFEVTQVETLDFSDLSDYVRKHHYTVKVASLDDKGWSLSDERTQTLLTKLHSKGVPLVEYVGDKIYYGIKTGLNEAFVIDTQTKKRLIDEDPKSEELIKPFLAGRDIKRYQLPNSDKYLIFMPKGWTSERSNKARNPWQWLQSSYPAIASHLLPFAEAGEKRCDKGEYWWELRTCDYYDRFEKSKIIIPTIVQNASYSLDRNGLYSNDKTSIIATDDLYLLGILNSKIADFVVHLISSTKQGGYFEYKPMYVQSIPIRTVNHSDPSDVARHDRMVSLVDAMLSLKRQIAEARTSHEQTLLQRQIEATDKQIDQLVYELYGLTEEEIKIVESGK